MPVTSIKSRWSSGSLIFHESTSLADTVNLLTLATSAVTVGNASNDVDFVVNLTGSGSVTVDYGAGSIKLVACDLDLSTSGTGVYDVILKDAVADALSIRRATTDMMVFNSSTPSITFTPTVLFTAAITPAASDGAALGSATVMWADLFLASGGVINFNNGNVTLTHAATKLTMSGGEFDLYAFHSTTAGSGFPLSATQTGAGRFYGDDVAASISSGTFVRTLLGRTLLNYNGTQECEAGGVVGQLVASTTTVGHNDAGTWGSWEAVGTVTTAGTASDNIHAGVLGRVGAGATVTLTVSANSVLAAVAAMSNINTGSTATYTGIYAGFYAGAWASADTFPYGIYIGESIQAGYFNCDAGNITSESHGVDIISTGTLASGKSLVGHNIAVTTAGTAGTWVSAIYAKVTQGDTKNVNGYISAAELELVLGAGYNLSDHGVLVLNYNSTNVQLANCSHPAYVFLRDYSSGDKMPNLFWFGDAAIGSLSATSLLSTTNDQAATHTIKFLIDSTPYWILCRNVAPA